MAPAGRVALIAAVYLVLIEHGRILLVRRSNTGYQDGNYSLVAGHLEADESLTQAMAREAMEEAGVGIQREDLEVVHVMHRTAPDSERIDLFMKPASWSNSPRIMEPDKCDDMGWFPLNDLPDNTIPYVRQAIDMIVASESYSEHGW